MISHLGIKITEIGPDFLKATMPVNEKTQQPYGYLNGGASMALIENLAGAAGSLCVDYKKFACVGLEINGNHIRAVKGESWVEGIARPLHVGRTTQVWEVKVYEKAEKLCCVGRMTISVVEVK